MNDAASNSGRHFVLDTNVLLHAPACLIGFGGSTVVIPVDVIEELDKFKSRNDELGPLRMPHPPCRRRTGPCRPLAPRC